MYLTAGFSRRLAAGLLIILCLGAEARAADRQLRVNWTELAPNVTGRRILTVLTDGVMLEGKVAALKPEALVLEVKKTSDPIRFRGTADVPRELVSTLRVSRPGWKWRVIGPLTGFIGGGLAGGAIGGRVNPGGGFIISDGAATGITYGALGGAGLGYFAGHFADRHTTIIQITR
jgi:hypothetical protein